MCVPVVHVKMVVCARPQMTAATMCASVWAAGKGTHASLVSKKWNLMLYK